MKHETALTLKFRGVEARILDSLVRHGVFNTKSEAIRSALMHYSMEVGLLNRELFWKELEKVPRRRVSPAQLAKDLRALEYED